MAIAVQANLVQLRTAAMRAGGVLAEPAELNVPPPGAVRRFRETLFDRGALQAMEAGVLAAVLHEQWGRYCLMRWVFHESTLAGETNLALLTEDLEMRCETELRVKEAELHAMLWRYRHDERVRLDQGYAADPGRSRRDEWAASIPPLAANATPQTLQALACQYGGMLATIRWVMRPGSDWLAPEHFHLGDEPFDDA